MPARFRSARTWPGVDVPRSHSIQTARSLAGSVGRRSSAVGTTSAYAAPSGYMTAGYSGTPLAKKLGLLPGQVVVVVDEPASAPVSRVIPDGAASRTAL